MAHKKYRRKYLNILLIPDDESSPKNIKVRYSFLTAAGITLLVVLFLLLIGVFSYSRLVLQAYENISLRQENAELLKQVQQVNELSAEVSNLKALSQKVRNSLTGYVKIAENTEQPGESAGQTAEEESSNFSILTSIPIKAPIIGFISQEFKKPLHNGIDIVAPEGTPVVAAGSGTVLFTGWTVDGGNTIIIGHGNGYYTYYKHNLRNVVFSNQWVEQGQVIGYLGNSGQKSYGPHLHFEVWKDGEPINPKYLILEYN
ncbi:MAG: peptidoglycan DD-metalloendopeptidase family protein [Calditrichia bacterium]